MLSFTSFEFLVFFAAVMVVFYIIPLKVRPFLLLFASILYYLLAAKEALIYLMLLIVLSYFAGTYIQKNRNKAFLLVSIGIATTFLFGFKILNSYSYRIGSLLNISFENFIIPLGISFFSFRVISYLVDIYKGKINNSNFIDYALYVSFFPHIVSGPIARFNSFSNNLKENITSKRFNYEKLRGGLILILWGFFMKLVIADRLAIFVNIVLGNYQVYGSTEIILAIMMYAIEIYCDFAGYSNIANGCSMVLGFDPVINFLSPYFSKSFKEFWRRWHVSLSSWFKDYLYIPLGGNRVSKTRAYLNVIVVMLVSGLWHGIGAGFIVWGLLHGILQVLENVFAKKNADNRFSSRFLQTINMFLLLCVTWVFFYSSSIKDALMIFRQCFITWNPWVLFDGTLFNCGLVASEWNIVILSIAVLTAFDYVSYKTDKRFDEIITVEMTWFYWVILIALFSAVWILGIYGPYFSSSSFIYASF